MSRAISVPFDKGTLHFESVADARSCMSVFTFHSRVVAQILSDVLQAPKSADAEQVSALGYLNRDIAELICAIEVETCGVTDE